MINELVSIIVPIYNVEKYLNKCLDSILSQTYRNLEIILIDDGSTDSSGIICDDYASRDNRIIVVHQNNKGIVHARKEGVKVSNGKVIGYVDGDDWIEPNMIEELYTSIRQENVDIAMCGRYEDTGNYSREVYQGITAGKYDKKALIENVYPKMIVNEDFFEWGIFPGVWDKLFKRKALEPYQMSVDERLTMGEDAACSYPALLNAESICILQKCLYHYRQTTKSMIKQTQNNDLKEKFSVLFSSVNAVFGKYSDIYDLREQWKKYLLFLMVPRAGFLYTGIDELPFLFPFSQVKKGSKIAIYGMGTFGQLLYNYVKQSGFCDIVVCVDKNYVELSEQGIEVSSTNDLYKYSFDAIIIANSFSKVRMSIYNDLSHKYPKKLLHIMDESLLYTEETYSALRLTTDK